MTTGRTPPIPISMMVGYGRQDENDPHWVARPGGTDLWLLEYAVAGGADIRVGEDVYHIGPGDAICYQPGVPQYYHMAPAWEHYWAAFTPRAQWDELLAWPALAPGILHLHVHDEALRGQIVEMLGEGRTLAMAPWARGRDFLLNLVERVLLWLDTINPASRHALLDLRVRAALQYLSENYAHSIGMAELAAYCNLSPSRLAHLFRAEVGMAPLQFLTRYRLQRAEEMLLMSNLPISEIAYAVGYENPLYFSRLFKQHAGNSPSAFRRTGRSVPGND